MRFLFATILASTLCFSAYAQPENKDVALLSPDFIPVEKTIYYKLGERTIPVRVLQYGDRTDILCINLHDNENTAVEAAVSVLERRGGTLVRIENNEQRVIRFKLRGITYSFDPNRIFSKTGIEQTLRENRRTHPLAIAEVEKFAERLLQLIPENSSCIIALHNNTNEAYSVKTYLPGGAREPDARAVYMDTLQDVDDIAFTTDSLLYEQMAANGYNSIWQDNIRVKKDGSLSVYCGQKGLRYINIETEHGRLKQYAEMFDKLLSILTEKTNQPFNSSNEDSLLRIQKSVDN